MSTDVLSFEVKELLEDGTFYLGDVIVIKSKQNVRLRKFGNNVEQEISELAGHGILHLLRRSP
jgi:ssRNA-specific RNase YbeY (16S rRNA maturation enzyme)